MNTLFADKNIARLPAAMPPQLIVVVDTEEEFDWSQPLSREETRVTAMSEQHRAQAVFARYGVIPTYVVDYPVATQDAGRAPLKEFHAEGSCLIGAHLHPWVTPPHEESVTPRNSFAGNLPRRLETEKLKVLTEAIASNLETQPKVFRAGRYGIGPNTPAALESLGYEVDTSVVAETSFAADGGPDFRHLGPDPFWFGPERRLLEIPATAGFTGALAGLGAGFYEYLVSPAGMALHVPGLLARTRMFERIRLSPEGISLAEMTRLTRALIARGKKIFVLSYHSPTLRPGLTPYAATTRERDAFLTRLEAYLAFFLDELGGRSTTPLALRAATSHDGSLTTPEPSVQEVPVSGKGTVRQT